MKISIIKKAILLLLVLMAAVIGYRVAHKDGDPPESAEDLMEAHREPQYSGSLSCRECHERFYDLWSGSHHGLAMQPYTDDFAREHLLPQTESIAIEDKDAHYLAEIEANQGWIRETLSGQKKSYPIVHVMGGKNVYYFLTTLDRGRLQTLPLAYDVNKKQWFDAMASGIRHLPNNQGDVPVHWTDSMYTFNTSCYNCHVSQLSTNYDPETETYKTQWSEPGINCESCHGSGREHIDVCRAAPEDAPPEDTKIISVKGFNTEQTNSMCNSCHAKASPISSLFTPGNRYFDHFDLTTLESPDFYPDGRDLGENYTMTLWRMSPCVKNSDLDCIHCHTSSGRYRYQEPAQANHACLPCHQNQVEAPERHSRHAQVEKSPRCISCHMPMTQFARMNRTDHSMRPPVPEATLKYGSPNACNLCHTDKDAQWAQTKVASWGKDTRQEQYLLLSEFVDQARQADWRNLDPILDYIQKQNRDEIITSSLIRLLRTCDSNEKWPILIWILKNDPSPLVRARAAEALNGYLTDESLIALLRAAKDDFRLVRVRAAESLASVPPKQLHFAVDGALVIDNLRQDFERAKTELIEGLTTRPDHYRSLYNLGNIYMDQGEIDKALTAYQTAIKLRPDFIPSYVNIAFAYHAKGRKDLAESSFQEALKREPGNILIQTNLALLLGEMGRQLEAESAFRKVLDLDPDSATAAFNLAVLLADREPEESLAFSKKAFSLKPGNPEYAYTYAFYLHRSGQINEAIEVLQDMVERQTSHADAYFFLGQIFEQNGRLKDAKDTYLKAAGNMRLTESQRQEFYSRAEQIRRKPEGFLPIF